MLIVLSPAKTLDYETPLPPAFADLDAELSRPAFVKEAELLVERLRGFDAEAIAKLMELSPALAQLNVERFQAWRPRFTAKNSRAALLAFNNLLHTRQAVGSCMLAGLDPDVLAAHLVRDGRRRS